MRAMRGRGQSLPQGWIALLILALALSGLWAATSATSSAATDFSFSAAGDYGADGDASATLQAIGGSGVNFHIALGDMSYGALAPETAWCDFVKARVGATFPFELISGNHDSDGVGQGHISNFAQCLPHRLGPLSGTYGMEYYFDHGGLARFILISPDIALNGILYSYPAGSVRYNWVAGAIDGARAAGLPWVIVGMHKDCLSIGSKSCEIGPDLMNLLIAKKVDLVLDAHDHNYQRSKQLAHGGACASVTPGSYNAACVADSGADNAYTKGAGVVLTTAGTGGQVLYNINTSDPEIGYFAAWMGDNVSPRKGYLKVSVSSSQLTAQFVGTTSSSSFTDTFTIAEAAPQPTPTPTSTPGQTFTFTPTADTFVDASRRTTNFGTANSITLDRSPVQEAYLKFNVVGLTRPVTAASVRLYVTNASPGGGSIAKMTNTGWSETSVTYNSRPAIDGATLSSLGAVTAGQWYEFNVTSAVTGNGIISFGLKATDSDRVSYGSRERSGFRPQLIITQTP